MTQLIYAPAHWKGSQKTADAVRAEIARRYGAEEAEKYDPDINCFTLPTWNKLGYRVRKGEHAIRSITLIEEKDPTAKEGEQEEVQKYPKTVYLFYIKAAGTLHDNTSNSICQVSTRQKRRSVVFMWLVTET